MRTRTYALALLLTLFGLFATPAFAQDADTQQKQQLLERYVTPQRFGPLYQKVLAQYSGFVPAGKQTQVDAMVQNPDFQSHIFTLARQQAATTYSLPELQASARLLDSPTGQHLTQEINDKGLSFRNTDLSPEDKQALHDFSASPEGQSMAQKNKMFTAVLMGKIFKTFLAYQGNLAE